LTLYIIDASAMGPLIIPDEAGELIDTLPDILYSDQAMVPLHWRVEVANLARMAIRKRRLTETLLIDAFGALSVFDLIIDDQTDALAWTTILALAGKHNLTAYDAAYLELAMRTSRTIVTHNKALIDAAVRENVGVLTK
jgi:predicted nucleic acid-binding protein